MHIRTMSVMGLFSCPLLAEVLQPVHAHTHHVCDGPLQLPSLLGEDYNMLLHLAPFRTIRSLGVKELDCGADQLGSGDAIRSSSSLLLQDQDVLNGFIQS